MAKRLTLILLLITVSMPLFAKSARMSKRNLLKNSNTVVKGTVTDVTCTGEIIEDYCGTMTGYRAKVKVESSLKGEPFNNFYLNFYKYDFNKLCLGTSNTRHYEGEQAVYYLNCGVDGCRFTSWNGVDYIKKSTKPLPMCQIGNKR